MEKLQKSETARVEKEEEEYVAERAYYCGARAISKWDKDTAQEFLAAMPDGTSGYWDAVEKNQGEGNFTGADHFANFAAMEEAAFDIFERVLHDGEVREWEWFFCPGCFPGRFQGSHENRTGIWMKKSRRRIACGSL